MKIYVEISMYPLSKEYESILLDFIKRLNAHKNIIIETNGMSTHVFGEYDAVFKAITKEMKDDFTKSDTVVFVMKCVNAHLQKLK